MKREKQEAIIEAVLFTMGESVEISKLAELIEAIRTHASEIVGEEREMLDSNLEVIEEEMKSQKPKKGFIKSAISWLKGLKCSVELASAIASLVTFIAPLV